MYVPTVRERGRVLEEWLLTESYYTIILATFITNRQDGDTWAGGVMRKVGEVTAKTG